MKTKMAFAALFVLLGMPALAARRGTEPLIDPSGNTVILPLDINNEGQIVGQNRATHTGFLKTGTEWTLIQYPGGLETFPSSINDFGAIVGTYESSDHTPGPIHGFLYDNGAYRTVDYPGARDTFLHGINNLGHIVGQASVPTPTGSLHVGFVLIGNEFIMLEFPGIGPAFPLGIDNDGTIVGEIPTGFFSTRAGAWQIIEGLGVLRPNVYHQLIAISGGRLLARLVDAAQAAVFIDYFIVKKHRTIPLDLEPDQTLTGINDKGDVVGWTIVTLGFEGFLSSVKALRSRD